MPSFSVDVRRRLAGCVSLAGLALTCVSLLPAQAAGSHTVNDTLLSFTPATVVDPILFGGEPGLNFDPTTSGGTRSFVDWPVSSRQNIGVLFRSEDGGLTYGKRYADPTSATEAGPLCTGRQIPTCGGGGGGDTDVNIASDGRIYFSSQESLADQLMGTSFDHGTTFPADHVDPVVSKCGPVDRQWIGRWDGTKTVFLAYHVPAVGECINRSDDEGATASWSVPAGPQVPLVTQSGALIVDNTGGIHNQTLYVGYLDFDTGGFTVATSTDGAATFVKHPLPEVNPDGNFTKINIDKAGNLYATWIENNATMLSTSKADHGDNVTAPASEWSAPVQVSDHPVNIAIFSDVVAGDPGRIGIIYYGTSAEAASPDDVKPGDGGWYPYVATSYDALCQWNATPCQSPTFHQAQIAHRINQDDNICTAGTTCAATGGNRNLLDYFDISLDTNGHLGFVWTDTNNATKMGYIKVARQATGPSLYVGKPNANKPMRGNGWADPSGDAKYPIYGKAIDTAQSHPTLDLLGTTVKLKDPETLEVRMKLVQGTGLAPGVPGGGTGTDGSTPIQQAKYVTRWDFEGHSYYVGANVPAGSSADTQPTYFSGETSNAEGVLAAGGGTTYYGNSYKPLTAATGEVINNEMVIDVPTSVVGDVTKGSSLLSVGSYAMVGPQDNLVVLNTIPVTVDSTPTFDMVLGSAASGGTSGGGGTGSSGGSRGGGGSGGGGLPATGTSPALALAGLALLGGGLVVRRRMA
jgi:LPXTG-motif cell wall-anchored protein